MAKQRYEVIRLADSTLVMIDQMNNIIHEYVEQGFRLTVRQLYYQLVARDIIPNNERSYDRICDTANKARLAGFMDWDAIEDRTRAFVRRSRWGSGADILVTCAQSFHMDLWETQDYRPFVIIEKEALVGVLEDVCNELDVPLLAARGYPSASVLREFAERDLLPTMQAGQRPVIIHLGDHDPSGIDMSRDLQDRLTMFTDAHIEFERIALNMDQIEERNPPPNPAKTTDCRYRAYSEQFGDESWELDALPPTYLVELVEKKIATYCDTDELSARKEKIASIRSKLDRFARIAERFRY